VVKNPELKAYWILLIRNKRSHFMTGDFFKRAIKKLIGSRLTESYRLRLKKKAAVELDRRRKEEYLASSAPKEACHLKGLFVRHDGIAFPCCRVGYVEDFAIGHIEDPMFFELLQQYQRYCVCGGRRLRKALTGEKSDFAVLNIEVSLACQGKCAMCCVEAPDWQGKYDLYQALSILVEKLAPREIYVQGGEVLIQRKSLDWLAGIREKHCDIKIILITNGNVEPEMLDEVERLFARVMISFPGFQEATYRSITSMDVRRTIAFAEALFERGKVPVYPKYLITPLNVHETSLFLDWALRFSPEQIDIAESDVYQYIRLDTLHAYWSRIIARAAKDVQSLLIDNANRLQQGNTRISCDSRSMSLLGLDKEFLRNNGLQEQVFLQF
jgi:Radical SAM superfamily